MQGSIPCLEVKIPHMECQVPVLWMESQITTLRFTFPESKIQGFVGIPPLHVLGLLTYLENQILLLQISYYECKTLYLCNLPKLLGSILGIEDSKPGWLSSTLSGPDDLPRGSGSNLEGRVPGLERALSYRLLWSLIPCLKGQDPCIKVEVPTPECQILQLERQAHIWRESSGMEFRTHIWGPGSMFEGYILYQEGNCFCLDV